jgi:DNA-binding Lrp family transcriptional regulator
MQLYNSKQDSGFHSEQNIYKFNKSLNGRGIYRMNLNKNELSVVKHLINNSRTSDAAVARTLNISLQAVRNIRKKLEKRQLIKNYSTVLDYEKLNINVFAIAMYKVTPQAWQDFNEATIEKWLLHPIVTGFYRIPHGELTHVIHYGFRDMIEMNNSFQTLQSRFGSYIEVVRVLPVCNGNIVKESHSSLVNFILNPRSEAPKPLDLKKA